jgi:hypothetical protein
MEETRELKCINRGSLGQQKFDIALVKDVALPHLPQKRQVGASQTIYRKHKRQTRWVELHKLIKIFFLDEKEKDRSCKPISNRRLFCDWRFQPTAV